MNKYQKLVKIFRKQAEKDWGKKCKDFDFGCIVCRAHRLIDDLENLGGYLDSEDNSFKKHKHDRK